MRYGGVPADLRRLTTELVDWLSRLPVVQPVDGHLLLHADSDAYAELGHTVADANAAAEAILAAREPAAWSLLCRRLNRRGAFRHGDANPTHDAVLRMLATLGGHTIVHGHSTLPNHFGLVPPQSLSAHRYAEGRVIAVDGGVFQDGALLVTRLF